MKDFEFLTVEEVKEIFNEAWYKNDGRLFLHKTLNSLLNEKCKKDDCVVTDIGRINWGYSYESVQENRSSLFFFTRPIEEEKDECLFKHEAVEDLFKDAFKVLGTLAKYCPQCGESLGTGEDKS